MYNLQHQGFNWLTFKCPKLFYELITTILSDLPPVEQDLICNTPHYTDQALSNPILCSSVKDFLLFNVRFQWSPANNLCVKFPAFEISLSLEFKFTNIQKMYAMIAIHTNRTKFPLNASVLSEIWRLIKNIHGNISDKETTNTTEIKAVQDIWQHLLTLPI